MKRKILSTLLAVTMLATLFTGCGNKEESSSNTGVSSDSKLEAQQEETDNGESINAESEDVAETTEQEDEIVNTGSTKEYKLIYTVDRGALILVYEYDENGILRSRKSYRTQDLLTPENYCVYDEKGNVIWELIYSNFEPMLWYNYEYDENGILLCCHNYEFDNNYVVEKNTYNFNEEFEYEFDSEGNIKKIIELDSPENYAEYEYDEKGRITKETINGMTDFSNKKTYHGSTSDIERIYTYSENDKQYTIERHYSDGNILLSYYWDGIRLWNFDEGEIPDEGYVCELDEMGRIKRSERIKGGSVYSNYEFKYNDSNNLESILEDIDTPISYEYKYIDGKIVEVTRVNGDTTRNYNYEYDTYGNIIQDSLVQNSYDLHATREYDENGNLIKVSCFGDDEMEADEIWEYEYDENGFLTEYSCTDKDGTISHSLIFYE